MRWPLVLLLAACWTKSAPPTTSTPATTSSAPQLKPASTPAAPAAAPCTGTTRSFAIFDLESDPTVNVDAKTFSDAFRGQAVGAPCITLKTPSRSMTDAKLAANCKSEHPNCIAKIGLEEAADFVVHGRAEATGGLRIGVKVLSVAKKQLVASWTNQVADPVDAAREAFGKLLAAP